MEGLGSVPISGDVLGLDTGSKGPDAGRKAVGLDPRGKGKRKNNRRQGA